MNMVVAGLAGWEDTDGGQLPGGTADGPHAHGVVILDHQRPQAANVLVEDLRKVWLKTLDW